MLSTHYETLRFPKLRVPLLLHCMCRYCLALCTSPVNIGAERINMKRTCRLNLLCPSSISTIFRTILLLSFLLLLLVSLFSAFLQCSFSNFHFNIFLLVQLVIYSVFLKLFCLFLQFPSWVWSTLIAFLLTAFQNKMFCSFLFLDF